MPITYTLDSEDEEIARQLVETGRYATIAEVVRDGLHRLAADDFVQGYAPGELKALVDEGEASGMLEEDGEVTLRRLHDHYMAMAAARVGE